MGRGQLDQDSRHIGRIPFPSTVVYAIIKKAGFPSVHMVWQELLGKSPRQSCLFSAFSLLIIFGDNRIEIFYLCHQCLLLTAHSNGDCGSIADSSPSPSPISARDPWDMPPQFIYFLY